MSLNNKKRIVITGLGTVNPVGNNINDSWKSILSGQSGAAEITQFDASQLDMRFACEVKNFEPLDYFDRKELRRTDRFNQIGIVAAEEAIKQSGISSDKIDKSRVGINLASGMGGLNTLETQHSVVVANPRRMSPFFIPSSIANMFAGLVSIRHGFTGPNLCIVTACSSSAHAVGESARVIERGDADVMIAGGSESTICIMAVCGFNNMKALSKRNDAPTKASRPFDKDRDGFVLGEGAAALVLESLDHAKARGAHIIAEVCGYARNADAFHETNPSPGGRGAAECMKLAIKDAGITPDQINHINTHGTSTPAGDLAESAAVNSVFEAHTKNIKCVSTKSMTGHTLGAAGALETVFATMAVANNICPPTINVENQDPDCNINICHEATEATIQYAMNNSFGFGGTNASLCIGKYND